MAQPVSAAAAAARGGGTGVIASWRDGGGRGIVGFFAGGLCVARMD